MEADEDGENQAGLREAGARPPGQTDKHYHGHRNRLRERFDEAGADGLLDYELLELVLYRLIPRVDTKPIAKQLIERFGSLSGTLGASREELTRIPGIGQAAARDLRAIAALHTRAQRGDLKGRQVLGSWSKVIDYCTAAMAHEEREQFRLLFLDRKNQLIRDEVQQTGTVDHTPVYPREIVRRALELSATAIILVHNHPSGDPTPSRADIEMTKTIIDIAAPLDITVHDHIIIGRDSHVSMRGLKLI